MENELVALRVEIAESNIYFAEELRLQKNSCEDGTLVEAGLSGSWDLRSSHRGTAEVLSEARPPIGRPGPS